MVFRASDLVVGAVRAKVRAAAYAVETCNCCQGIQTCKSCTNTAPPSTCRPPSTACGGTLIVSKRTLELLQQQLDAVLSEFYVTTGAAKPSRAKKSKRGARKKK